MTPDTLLSMSRSELAAAMTRGRTFSPHEVAGSVYAGISLGLPPWIERVTWKKFAKAFARDGRHGWNIRIEQDGLDRAWRPQRRRGAPITFGRFAIAETDGGIVLDYRGGPMHPLRDPLVALDERADVLLGRSLLALGSWMIPTPSYFVLTRDPSLGPS